jgi:hypothetical protein
VPLKTCTPGKDTSSAKSASSELRTLTERAASPVASQVVSRDDPGLVVRALALAPVGWSGAGTVSAAVGKCQLDPAAVGRCQLDPWKPTKPRQSPS